MHYYCFGDTSYHLHAPCQSQAQPFPWILQSWLKCKVYRTASGSKLPLGSQVRLNSLLPSSRRGGCRRPATSSAAWQWSFPASKIQKKFGLHNEMYCSYRILGVFFGTPPLPAVLFWRSAAPLKNWPAQRKSAKKYNCARQNSKQERTPVLFATLAVAVAFFK